MTTYRKATISDKESLVSIVIGAFHDYPIFRHFTKNEKQHKEFLRILMDVDIMTHLKKHTCIVGVENDAIISVALLRSPNDTSIGFTDYMSFGAMRIMKCIGVVKTLRLLKMVSVMEHVSDVDGRSAWVLNTLAVAISSQGKGLGSRMLNDYIAPYIASNGGGVLTLVTNTDLDCKFYLKNGFNQIRKAIVKSGHVSLPTWGFVKAID